MLSQTLAITFLLFIGIFPNPDFKENNTNTSSIDPVTAIYDGLHIKNGVLPSREVFTLAIQGWNKMKGNLKSKVLTVIDFSLPSTAKRMWVIDPEKGEVLLNSVVSHGRNSGDLMAKGFNDQARNRAIVIHGADYAREEFAESVGRLGRSLGCPALPSELSAQAIDLIKDGSLLFIFGKDDNYLSKSSLIKA